MAIDMLKTHRINPQLMIGDYLGVQPEKNIRYNEYTFNLADRNASDFATSMCRNLTLNGYHSIVLDSRMGEQEIVCTGRQSCIIVIRGWTHQGAFLKAVNGARDHVFPGGGAVVIVQSEADRIRAKEFSEPDPDIIAKAGSREFGLPYLSCVLGNVYLVGLQEPEYPTRIAGYLGDLQGFLTHAALDTGTFHHGWIRGANKDGECDYIVLVANAKTPDQDLESAVREAQEQVKSRRGFVVVAYRQQV